jgi:hypothetical protein
VHVSILSNPIKCKITVIFFTKLVFLYYNCNIIGEYGTAMLFVEKMMVQNANHDSDVISSIFFHSKLCACRFSDSFTDPSDVNFINVFLRTFFVRIFGAKPNVTRENGVCTKNLYVYR